MIDLASNDYLGLTAHPQVRAAAVAAVQEWGTGAASSRVVRGTLPVHRDLEAALAHILGRDAALVLSTGYHANLAALCTIGSPEAPIIIDAHAHASLVDGARLSQRRIWYFDHNDVEHVATLLRTHGEPGAVVVTEGVFSVLGDLGQIDDLAPLCADFGATLLIDEAHSVGVIGENAAGVQGAGVGANRVVGDHVVITGTCSKSLAAQGGFVAGPQQIITQLASSARPFVYDTGLAPPSAAAALAAVEHIVNHPESVLQLRRNADLLAQVVGCDMPGAVASLPETSPGRAAAIAAELHEAGVDVGVFRPQSTPDRRGRLRLTAHATTTTEDVRYAAPLIQELVAGL